MFGDKGFFSARDAGGVFQKRSRCENAVGGISRKGERKRRVAAGTAHRLDAVFCIAHHGVVTAYDDVAVVQQKDVGNAHEPSVGFLVTGHQRFAPGIGACHHKREVHGAVFKREVRFRLPEVFVKKKQVHRRIGEHHAHLAETPGDTRRKKPVGRLGFGRKDNRSRNGSKRLYACRRQPHEF